MVSAHKKEKLKRLSHFLVGFIILVHAYERHEAGHGNYLLFLIAGIVFISVAIFHHKLAQRFPLVDLTFIIIEGILTLTIAYEYFAAGKQLLPYVYLFAGLVQIFAIIWFTKKKRVKHANH